MGVTVETRYRVTVDGTVLDLDEAAATAIMEALAARLLPHIGVTPVQTRVHVLDPAPRALPPEPKAIAAPVAPPEPESPPESPPASAFKFADELVTGHYSEEEIARLKEWIAAEVPLEEMARQLRRTKASVYAKLGQIRFDMFRARIAAVAPTWQAWEARRLADHLARPKDRGEDDLDALVRMLKRPVEEIQAVIAHLTDSPASEPASAPGPEPAPPLKTGPDDWTHEETRALIRVLGDTRGGTFKEAVAATGHTMLSCDRRWRHLKQAGLMTVAAYKASQESLLAGEE